MATHTISITNTVNVFGPADTSLWGTAVWDTDAWGTDNNTYFTVNKALGSETLTSTDVFVFKPMNVRSNTMSIADAYSFRRAAGSDVFYFVRDGVDQFSKVSDGTDGFSTFTATSTSWTLL